MCFHSFSLGTLTPLSVEGLAQLGGEILNGALSLLALGASFLVTAVISAVLLVPFRFIAVRKDSILTRIEARGTLIVILVCTAVSLISAAIFGGAGCMVVALVLMIPDRKSVV